MNTWWRGNGNLVSSLIVCNAILSPHEQSLICDAAVNAEEGYTEAAEEIRCQAGYGGLT